MGLGSFLKKIFSLGGEDDAELRAAREKHGIETDEEDKEEDKRQQVPYDPWEEIRNMRANFLFGSWVTRKFKPIGQEKLKRDLEALEKKRKGKEEKGE